MKPLYFEGVAEPYLRYEDVAPLIEAVRAVLAAHNRDIPEELYRDELQDPIDKLKEVMGDE